MTTRFDYHRGGSTFSATVAYGNTSTLESTVAIPYDPKLATCTTSGVLTWQCSACPYTARITVTVSSLGVTTTMLLPALPRSGSTVRGVALHGECNPSTGEANFCAVAALWFVSGHSWVSTWVLEYQDSSHIMSLSRTLDPLKLPVSATSIEAVRRVPASVTPSAAFVVCLNAIASLALLTVPSDGSVCRIHQTKHEALRKCIAVKTCVYMSRDREVRVITTAAAAASARHDDDADDDRLGTSEETPLAVEVLLDVVTTNSEVDGGEEWDYRKSFPWLTASTTAMGVENGGVAAVVDNNSFTSDAATSFAEDSGTHDGDAETSSVASSTSSMINSPLEVRSSTRNRQPRPVGKVSFLPSKMSNNASLFFASIGGALFVTRLGTSHLIVQHDGEEVCAIETSWYELHEVASIVTLWDWNTIRLHRVKAGDRSCPKLVATLALHVSDLSFGSIIVGLNPLVSQEAPSCYVTDGQTMQVVPIHFAATGGREKTSPSAAVDQPLVQSKLLTSKEVVVRAVTTGRQFIHVARLTSSGIDETTIAIGSEVCSALHLLRRCGNGDIRVLIGCMSGLVMAADVFLQSPWTIAAQATRLHWHSDAVAAFQELAPHGVWCEIYGGGFLSVDVCGEVCVHFDTKRTTLSPPVVHESMHHRQGDWSLILDTDRGWIHHVTPGGALVWHATSTSLIHESRGASAYDPNTRGSIVVRGGTPLLRSVSRTSVTPMRTFITGRPTNLIQIDLKSVVSNLDHDSAETRVALHFVVPIVGPATRAFVQRPFPLESVERILPSGATLINPADDPHGWAAQLVAVETIFIAFGDEANAAHAEWCDVVSQQGTTADSGFVDLGLDHLLSFAFFHEAAVARASRNALVLALTSVPPDAVKRFQNRHAALALDMAEETAPGDTTTFQVVCVSPEGKVASEEGGRSLLGLALLAIATARNHTTRTFDIRPDVLENTVAALVGYGRTFRSPTASNVACVLLDVLCDGWPVFRSLVANEDRDALWAHLLADAAAEGDAALMNYSAELVGRTVRALGVLGVAQLTAFTQFALTVAAESPQRFVKLPFTGSALHALTFHSRKRRAEKLGTVPGHETPSADGNHIRVAALRVCHAVCIRYPDRWQKCVHPVLRMVWACIDPHTPAPAMRRLCAPAVASLFKAAVDNVGTFAFNASLQRVAASNGDEPQITIYDIKTTSKIAVFGSESVGVPIAITFGADGTTVITLARGASELLIWNIESSTSLFGLVASGTTVRISDRVALPSNLRVATPPSRPRLILITPVCVEVQGFCSIQDPHIPVRIMIGKSV